MSSQRGERGVARPRGAARTVTDSNESQYMIQQLASLIGTCNTQRPEREIRHSNDPRTALAREKLRLKYIIDRKPAAVGIMCTVGPSPSQDQAK
jgi:hypothetical protein